MTCVNGDDKRFFDVFDNIKCDSALDLKIEKIRDSCFANFVPKQVEA